MLSVFQPDVPFDDIYGGGEGLMWRDRAGGAGVVGRAMTTGT